MCLFWILVLDRIFDSILKIGFLNKNKLVDIVLLTGNIVQNNLLDYFLFFELGFKFYFCIL